MTEETEGPDEVMNEGRNMEELLTLVGRAVAPSAVDELAREALATPGAERALVRTMAEGRHVRECYRVLTRADLSAVARELEALLDAPDESVRRYAMLTLSDAGGAHAQGARLGAALRSWLEGIPSPPSDEKEAVETVNAAERLARVARLDASDAARLRDVLFFIPRGVYREINWPRTWVRASRLLGRLGFAEMLSEVARGERTHYLSAAGALALAREGATDAPVSEWLKNSRDYFLLDEEERRELAVVLSRLGDAGPELEKLKSLT